MALAMDRDWKSPPRRIGLGLALALGTFDLGCSKLDSFTRSEPPAMLGVQRTTRDVYADAHAPRASTTVAAAPLTAATEMESVRIVEGSEVGMAIRPAVPGDTGVTIEPPESIAPSTASKPPSPTIGVPNSSILLASTERRNPPIAAPATAGETPDHLVAEARLALDGMMSYQVLMHRQERVNGALQPEEDVVLAVRRQPRAVRLSWPTGPHKGREVLYRSDEPGGLMHVNLADTALPIPRLSIPPDSPMVMKNSRHPVTEAGFDSIVLGMEEGLKSSGRSGITYNGLETPPPLDRPHHCLVRRGTSGEVSRVYIDPQTHLPALITVNGPDGEMLERYVFRDILPNLPELASAAAFDPVARWGPPRGLFGRIARGPEDTVQPPR